jgi:uncharacterized LabA/DUF88 family protein
MQVTLFIDYDNLIGLQKRAGLLAIATKALLANPLRTARSTGRCDVRVYGGWYEGSSLTPLAQKVITEIQSDFPTVIRGSTETGGVCALSVQADLACSLSEEPAHHLLDTFRKKRPPSNLKCADPADLGCTQPSCTAKALALLFDRERCPKPNCSFELKDLIYRNEQKLVDTMLTCDMIHAASQRCDLIIVISGDDDILPAIRTATLRGTPVVRLHTKPFMRRTIFPLGGATLVEQCL